jgi:dienelactone hydrolase
MFATYGETVLELDFYKPSEAGPNLPLVLYVHGGGFKKGQRNSPGIQYFAKRLAKRGFAVAAISYRLTLVEEAEEECEIPAAKKVEAIQSAAKDVTLAIYYLMKNPELFPIDPKRIVLAGSSAGAEAVLHVVYGMPAEDKKDMPKFAGVISLSGAVMDINHVNAATAIPTQLFHGIQDEVVPYDSGIHQQCGDSTAGYFMLYGSRAIATELKTLKQPYYLYSIDEGTHSWAGVPTKKSFNEIIDFIYFDVLFPQMGRQTERVVRETK